MFGNSMFGPLNNFDRGNDLYHVQSTLANKCGQYTICYQGSQHRGESRKILDRSLKKVEHWPKYLEALTTMSFRTLFPSGLMNDRFIFILNTSII